MNRLDTVPVLPLHPVTFAHNSPLAPTPLPCHCTQTRDLQFVVFDDAGGDDPLRSIIGVANVPLAGLAAGESPTKLWNPYSHGHGLRPWNPKFSSCWLSWYYQW